MYNDVCETCGTGIAYCSLSAPGTVGFTFACADGYVFNAALDTCEVVADETTCPIGLYFDPEEAGSVKCKPCTAGARTCTKLSTGSSDPAPLECNFGLMHKRSGSFADKCVQRPGFARKTNTLTNFAYGLQCAPGTPLCDATGISTAADSQTPSKATVCIPGLYPFGSRAVESKKRVTLFPYEAHVAMLAD
jgi:hypothetical protein